jgi:hypothetical protein
LQFNDSSSEKQGIVQDVYYLVNANSTSYPIGDLTRNANRGLDKAVTKILGADGRWQFDDTNATDLPIGSTTITSGQQDYSFDEEYLTILDIIATDANGNETRLIPIDNADMGRDQAITEFQSVSGTPIYYDKMGESILLYPTPNYTSTKESGGGLKAYFQRKISYFTTTDTTKEPGFAKHLHRYISLSAAFDYAISKGLPKAQSLRNEMLVMEKEIEEFYAYRERDQRRRIQPATPDLPIRWGRGGW